MKLFTKEKQVKEKYRDKALLTSSSLKTDEIEDIENPFIKERLKKISLRKQILLLFEIKNILTYGEILAGLDRCFATDRTPESISGTISFLIQNKKIESLDPGIFRLIKR